MTAIVMGANSKLSRQFLNFELKYKNLRKIDLLCTYCTGMAKIGKYFIQFFLGF